MPSASIVSSTARADPISSITDDSVISRTSRLAGSPCRPMICSTSAGKSGSASCTIETLTATSRSDGAAPHATASATTSSRIFVPSGTISPVSSASGMNRSGGSSPSVGCSQRTSASTAGPARGAEVEERLVVHDELVALDRSAEVRLQGDALERLLAQALVEHRAAAGAALLRRVHRGVGVAHQAVGVRRMVVGGDADGDGEEELAAVEDERRGDRGVETVGDRVDPIGVGVGHEDRELVAAEARDRRLARDGVGEAARDLLEDPVAGRVTEAVVDQLEAVEVEEHHRDPGRRVGELLGDQLQEPGAVRQAR